MKKVLFVVLISMLFIPVIGNAKKDVSLDGTYIVTGFNPGASTSGDPSYTGILEVSQFGGAYILDWRLGEGLDESYRGVGIYSDGVLSVGVKGGVASYKVETNEKLKGVWLPKEGGLFGFELCERKR